MGWTRPRAYSAFVSSTVPESDEQCGTREFHGYPVHGIFDPLTSICLHLSPVQLLAALRRLHVKRLGNFRHAPLSLWPRNISRLLILLTQMILDHFLWTRFAANRAKGEALLSLSSNLPHPQLEGTGISNQHKVLWLVSGLRPLLPPQVDHSH